MTVKSKNLRDCGTSHEALDAALEAGADYVGLVFYPLESLAMSRALMRRGNWLRVQRAVARRAWRFWSMQAMTAR